MGSRKNFTKGYVNARGGVARRGVRYNPQRSM